MRPLPADFLRCRPSSPDSWCRNCKAWCEQPRQPAQARQLLTTNSNDAACIYQPLSLLKRQAGPAVASHGLSAAGSSA